MIRYGKANGSPILNIFLWRIDGLLGRASHAGAE
jgi:hypothetical protein